MRPGLRRLGRAGQPDPEGGAAALPVLDPGAAAVQLGEASDEGEADADAELAAARVGLLERLEDVAGQRRIDPGTGVVHRDQDAVAVPPDPNPYRRARRRVPGGVAEQVLDDAV